MLFMRKLRHHLFSLLTNRGYNSVRISHLQIPESWSRVRIYEPLGYSLRYSGFKTGVLVDLNRFAYATRFFASMTGTILVQARDPAKLSLEIENAVDERRYADVWKFFEQHIQMDGFPRKTVVNKVITSFAGSLDNTWLEKAYGVVEQAFEESKQNLFEKEPLINLSLGLSKCGLPVPASAVLRKLVPTEQYPPVSAWSAILAHMSLTASGAYLAAELIF
ncbi:pentatricopeptide repeat-containing protein At1g03100, mitochondrial-like [Pistacia vera]|uniref:pentatricopeptide repeat-containing protein At1g03100, mitochondrial-like n=1 Tax=Pistacia vera TaxID=55513 RepID=UPI0012632713|nr:pentatricopeptide repeat-containing protein At1g03100, mitochondrial-like [Pistacia vera]